MPAHVAQLVEAFGHPMRTELLRHLGRESASMLELAQELGTAVSQVRKHLTLLESLGLVVATRSPEERMRRGRGAIVFWRADLARVEELGKVWLAYVTGRDPPPAGADDSA